MPVKLAMYTPMFCYAGMINNQCTAPQRMSSRETDKPVCVLVYVLCSENTKWVF